MKSSEESFGFHLFPSFDHLRWLSIAETRYRVEAHIVCGMSVTTAIVMIVIITQYSVFLPRIAISQNLD